MNHVAHEALRLLAVVALTMVLFGGAAGAVHAQGATPIATTPVIAGAPAGATTRVTVTPSTLPATGGYGAGIDTATVILLALGAIALLAGFVMRGLGKPL